MRVSSLLPRSFAALLVAAPLFVTAASAQAPATVRIRGAIEAVDGSVLTIKSREGSEMKVHLTDNVAVIGIAKASLADIKPNSYIGVSGMPEADGTQKALAIHIFPEAQRGTGEGFRAWDLRPNSTMTNATVAQTVAGTDGQNILVKYKDGEKKVVVGRGYPDRLLRDRRQDRIEAGRQDHHLRCHQKGRWHARNQPCRRRHRRHHAADVSVGAFSGIAENGAARFASGGLPRSGIPSAPEMICETAARR